MSRKRSIPLIIFGSVLLLVGVLGALFPFVPVLFSDAEFLSGNVRHAAQDLGDATLDAASLPGPQDPSGTQVPSPSPQPVPNPVIDNRLFIDKIGVSVPIVEGKDAGALLYGAWRYPGTSTPLKGANTVIFGHRFRYLPPNNTTFYKLDKVKVGDAFTIRWRGKMYRYIVTQAKIIEPTDFSVIQPTEKPTITLITCSPLFSTKQRLVVTAELSS